MRSGRAVNIKTDADPAPIRRHARNIKKKDRRSDQKMKNIKTKHQNHRFDYTK
jgi:hypothetical protein